MRVSWEREGVEGELGEGGSEGEGELGEGGSESEGELGEGGREGEDSFTCTFMYM